MKRIFTLAFLLPFLFAKGQSTTVVISQVYGGGGGSTGTYLYDYVELHNVSGSSQLLTGYSIQYGSATGNFGSSATNIYAFPAGTSIAAGGYLLIQLGAAGSAGAALPVAPDLVTTNLSMSGTSGKVCLVTQTTGMGCGATATPCTLTNPPFIDVVSYGASNNGEGGTTANNGSAITSTQGVVRKNNGCQDTDNNNNDFNVVSAPVPRNSASSNFPCVIVPLLSVNPSSLSLSSLSVGVASPSLPFTLSGSNLTPASGTINVTASSNFEISTDNITFTSSLSPIAYSSGSLSSTTIYVRLAATAPAGISSGTVTCSGGGASNGVISLTGGVTQNYYNTKANLGLTTLGSWSTTVDGTGPSPANFTSGYQVFNIVNSANTSYTGVWDVSAAGSKIVVGDGTTPLTFTILTGIDSVTSATRVDVNNNGTLVILNNRRPFLNSLATGSTVDFAQTGTTSADTIKIPTISYYNLKFTGGLKYFSSGVTTLRGNFVADGVVSMNGAGSPFSTVNCFGNVTMQNSAAFEPNPTGDNGRITWKMNGPGPTQTITGNGATLLLFRLQRDSSATCNLIMSANTNLTLGNASGGGLSLTPAGTTLTTNSGTISFIGAATSTNTALGKITSNGTNFYMGKTAGTTANMGTLKFNTGSTVNNFTMNVDPAIARDSITVADNIDITGTLTLTKGKLVVSTGSTISLLSGATAVCPGNGLSFVDGALKRIGTSAFTFNVGKGNKYAPVDFSNITGGNTYTVQYVNTGYPVTTIDPATLGTYPNYNISLFEYWNIAQASAGSADLTFYYTDANSYINPPYNTIRMAHFDGTDWNDIAGIPGFNVATAGWVTVTGVSQFSPFTFAATSGGTIPVKLNLFTVSKFNNTVKLNWVTEQESNSKEFVIEKSTDGSNWSVIDIVNAAGYSSSKINYTTTDNNPVKGINYYRLKMLDNNNRFEYSAIRTVFFSSRYQVTVAPNPAKDFVNVYVAKDDNQAWSVEVTNMNGAKVYQSKTNQPMLSISTKAFAKGMYFVKITDAENVTVQKVIIQ